MTHVYVSAGFPQRTHSVEGIALVPGLQFVASLTQFQQKLTQQKLTGLRQMSNVVNHNLCIWDYS